METVERLLSEHPFFRDLDPHHLATVVGCASNVKFEPGEYLFREGDAAERFFVVRFGRVAVETSAPRGALTIETVDSGDVLGWSWLFPPYKCHFDARATALVRALALDGVCLRGKCEEDAVLGFELMKRFARLAVQRLEAAQVQLLDLYANHS
jgi:CRP/FNR family cyclic AMP-dependent transcriptional regulator